MNYFNSIKVRLKLNNPAAYNIDQYLFQFHKGTIKTQSSCFHSFKGLLFQFHKGTIKTEKIIESKNNWFISIP